MQVVLWILVGLLVATTIGLSALVVGMLRQHGRLLLRLDELEKRVGVRDEDADLSAEEFVTQGLEVGKRAPSFRLPDLGGSEVSLEDFRGRRLLLIHWSTTCGFCHEIADELGTLREDLAKQGVEMVVLSSGELEANRHLSEVHGLSCPILIQPDAEAAEVFRGMGTPVAYLLDEEGRVAEPLAFGAIAVPELAQRLAARRTLGSERDLSESRIERSGLKAGTAAPLFSLPTIDGGTVDLEDYRGRRVLLVFSDPHCGPCDALLPDLVRFDREERDDGWALLMVSRGRPEENVQKAEEYDIGFPLAIQPGWNVSKLYGIFATPVAFLIDEHGVIARDVAIASHEILALARSALEKGGMQRRLARLFGPRRKAEARGVA